MKTILLKRIEIKNFKGIGELSIDLTKRVQIYGRNGLGKTSILDAFLWCLFGKDSTGSSSFSVRPLNLDGTIKEHHDVDVACVLSVNGEVKTLRRRWIEKTDRNGKYKGNEGAYYINDVPIKEIEYKTVIAEICKEDLFTLITSTGAFNRMKDADRRAVLADMADTFDELEAAKEFPHIYEALASGKSFDIFKAEVKSGKSKAEIELNQYPTRLKENADSRPILPDDIALYPSKKMELEASISALNTRIKGEDNNDLKAQLKVGIDKLASDKAEIEGFKRKNRLARYTTLYERVQKLEKDIQMLKADSDKLSGSVKWHDDAIDRNEKKREGLLKEWAYINDYVPDTNIGSKCPTCGKPFTENEIEAQRNAVIEKFNKQKAELFDDVDKRGTAIAEEIADLHLSRKSALERKVDVDNDIKNKEQSLKIHKAEIDGLPTLELLLQSDPEYVSVCSQLEKKQAQLRSLELPSDEDEKIIEQKRLLEVELANIESKLAIQKQIDMLDLRKAKLEEEQKQAGELVAHYKMLEEEIWGYSIKKTDFIEQNVSSKFRFVKFKMFEYNLSNDNVREVCICTVNGVPYKDLNTAMRYNADIDIINTLSEHYGILAPIFIDRAESINNIEETMSQRIDLYATKEDTVLRIEKFN